MDRNVVRWARKGIFADRQTERVANIQTDRQATRQTKLETEIWTDT